MSSKEVCVVINQNLSRTEKPMMNRLTTLFTMENFKKWKKNIKTKTELNPETSLLQCQLYSVLVGRTAHRDGLSDPLWTVWGR